MIKSRLLVGIRGSRGRRGSLFQQRWDRRAGLRAGGVRAGGFGSRGVRAGRLRPRAAGGSYTIGFSNPLGVGNGFREEQLCTAKAQALVSGQVESGTWIHRNTDADGPAVRHP